LFVDIVFHCWLCVVCGYGCVWCEKEKERERREKKTVSDSLREKIYRSVSDTHLLG
jgi:hypothetical protein